MPTRIFLIRHAETDYSKNRRYCGQTDVSLNRFGRMQSGCLYNLFKKTRPLSIYLSDLSRARQTARIAFPGKVKLREDKRLREINFGCWEGLSSEEISRDYNGQYSKWLKSPDNVSIPGGEKLLSLKKRVKDFLAEILKRNENEEIAIVSHAGPIKVILFEVLGLRLESFWTMNQETAAVSLVECYDNYKTLKYFNYTGHLPKANVKF